MPDRLPVGKVLIGALLIPWWKRRAFVRALALPTVLLVAMTVAWEHGTSQPGIPWYLAMCALYGVLFALFAVRCHRLVLLDDEPAELMPRWSWRETKFFIWLAAIWALAFTVWYLFVVAMSVVIANTWGRGAENERLMWGIYLSGIPAYYVFARLSPIFPATAIDRAFSVRRAWGLTKENGWRLVLVVMLLPLAVSWLVGLLDREGGTIWEAIVLTTLGTVLLAFEIAALSLSYRELAASGEQD